VSSWWTRTDVMALADPRSFLRGVGYQRDGRVEIATRSDVAVVAVVRGSMPYEVELRAGSTPSWSCTCPVGEDGAFCKHCVAVALQVAEPERGGKRSKRVRQSKEPDLRRYLAGLHANELVELVMEQADADWRLRERLRAAALAVGGGAIDLRTWKDRIDAVFGGPGFVPYAEAPGWAEDVFDVIAALDDLVVAGHAAAVVHLAEHAHRRADGAVQYIDDSDGWLTDISGRIGELHLKACEIARPDPIELAGRLAELELTSELDTFHRAAATYAEVLGREGIAAYRGAVEPKWRQAKKKRTGPYSHDVFAATQAMIGIAQAGGDPEDLIAIRGDDLRTPDDYLEIAKSLVAAGRPDEAIDWSRRGLETFVERHWQTPPLREFLSAQLRTRGDAPGAEGLWWDAFEQHPSVDAYRKLVAETTSDVNARKQQSIAVLRARLEAGDTQPRSRNPLLERAPATTLVEILLYEGNVEEAWEAASTYGCDDRAWMTLARARESTHPLDAIPIYERAAAAQIDTKKNGGYRAAVELLARIGTLADKAGEPQRFTDLLATITAEHARKRNLIALIDKKRWS
jgi:uncharacterized Zn finger protein